MAPTVVMTDEDVIAVLHEHTSALSMTQIVSVIDRQLPEGIVAGISRSTVKVHLKRLVTEGQVVSLGAAEAVKYGARIDRNVPTALFYLLSEHRRAWDVTVAACGKAPLGAVRRRRAARVTPIERALVDAIAQARVDTEQDLLAAARGTRARVRTLTALLSEVGAERVARVEGALLQIEWLDSAARLAETAALETAARVCIPTRQRLALDRLVQLPEQPADVAAFRHAVRATWEATVRAGDRHEWSLDDGYVVGQGFLVSIRAGLPVTLSQLNRVVVRVLTGRAAPEPERRMRLISNADARRLGMPPTNRPDAVAKVMRIVPLPGPDALLAWWEHTDNRVELAAVVTCATPM